MPKKLFGNFKDKHLVYLKISAQENDLTDILLDTTFLYRVLNF